jgi:hypothetical protein
VTCKHISLPLFSLEGDATDSPAFSPESRRIESSFRPPFTFPFSSNLFRIAVSCVTSHRVLRHSPLRSSSKFQCSSQPCPGAAIFFALSAPSAANLCSSDFCPLCQLRALCVKSFSFPSITLPDRTSAWLLSGAIPTVRFVRDTSSNPAQPRGLNQPDLFPVTWSRDLHHRQSHAASSIIFRADLSQPRRSEALVLCIACSSNLRTANSNT